MPEYYTYETDPILATVRERDQLIARVEELEQKEEFAGSFIERLIQERDAYRVALEKYGRHRPGCRFLVGPCTCSLDAALEGITDA